MEVLKARYPKAVCLKSRNGYAVYTRKFGTHIGYPIKGNTQQFLIDALALKSDSIFDYKKLIDEFLKH